MIFQNKLGWEVAAWCLIFALSFSCENQTTKTDLNNSSVHKVEIKKVDGKHDFYIDNTIFKVKGAGISSKSESYFKAFAEAGGNTIRTWSTSNAEKELEWALKYNLKVAMGLHMGAQHRGFDYTNAAAVKEQFEKLKELILKYKDHPALLCWVAGNELNLLMNEDGTRGTVNPVVYDALAEVVDFVHEVDPNHPITTTFAEGAPLNHIQPLLERCPQIDLLAYQVYRKLETLTKTELENNIDIPYIITEFGPIGHWETPPTNWGREIEENSTEKAEGIWERMQKGLVENPSGRNLGGFVFLWGQKQERTPTWYGIFNKDGKPTAVLDEMTRFWTGKYPEDRAPAIKQMSIDSKTARDNIVLKPNQVYTCHVEAFDYKEEDLVYKWELSKEVDERSFGGHYEKEPSNVELDIIEENGGTLTFRTPNEKGEYRIFSYVYDKAKVANANIPILIE